MIHNVKVVWTGSYPCLCMGEWEIHIDGIKLTGLGNTPFNTLNTYQSWSFGEDWCEEWDSYKSGEYYEEWAKCPPNGLLESLKVHGIEPTPSLMEALYGEISSQDWRSGSCGGCL